jgi:hypothetical protein
LLNYIKKIFKKNNKEKFEEKSIKINNLINDIVKMQIVATMIKQEDFTFNQKKQLEFFRIGMIDYYSQNSKDKEFGEFYYEAQPTIGLIIEFGINEGFNVLKESSKYEAEQKAGFYAMHEFLTNDFDFDIKNFKENIPWLMSLSNIIIYEK